MALSSSSLVAVLAPFLVQALPSTPSLFPRDSPNSTSTSSSSSSTSSSSSSSSTSGNLKVSIWAPLVAVVVVILALIVISCVRQSRAERRLGAQPSTQAMAEAGASTSSTTGRTANNNRRNNRRTPSQISTRSLPAYMEEPAASDLVLLRGAESHDDMPTVEEDIAEGALHARQSTSLGSLAELAAAEDLSGLPPVSPARRMSGGPRRSVDSARSGSHGSHDVLLARTSPPARESVAMSDAPPYSAVVREDGGSHIEMLRMRSQEAPSTVSSTSPRQEASTPAPSSSEPRRHSGIRGFASRLSRLVPSSSSSDTVRDAAPAVPTPSIFIPIPPIPPSPPAAPTSNLPPPATRHRASTSGSGSTLTLTSSRHSLIHARSLRSLRRSPSTPALAPNPTAGATISAPLPHTLVRSEFRYPSAGATREQIAFINSRESLGRFGVPYGAAAQAHAWAASREALHLPEDEDVEPPPFESPVEEPEEAGREEDNGAERASAEERAAGAEEERPREDEAEVAAEPPEPPSLTVDTAQAQAALVPVPKTGPLTPPPTPPPAPAPVPNVIAAPAAS